MENEIIYVKLDDIIPNRFQPREVFDEQALNELATSIRQHGLIQPIVVRHIDNSKYEIIAGERRYKACVLAGLTKIPVIVKDLDDKESSIVAYVENAQRKNVSAIEEAKTCKRILDANNMTQDQLAKELGLSQSNLANKLRLLSLPLEVQEALMHNEISERHARSLLMVRDATAQLELLKKIKENRMTVRDLDSEIKKMNGNDDNLDSDLDEQRVNLYNQSIYNNKIPSSNENIVNQETKENQSFMSFLDNYNQKYGNNANQPISTENSMNQEEINKQNFTSFLDNYDSKYGNNVNQPISTENSMNQEEINKQNFTSFLDKYDQKYGSNPNSLDDSIDDNQHKSFNPNKYIIEESNQEIEQLNNGMPNNKPINNDFNKFGGKSEISNVSINDVNPPITSFVNSPSSYIENQPQYVDLTKPKEYDSVEEIIKELQITMNKFKNSKYKIDTEEINYDDVYQITIKINKNEVL